MNVSARCIEVIKHHEGVRYRPYRCPAKLWTIGVGHVMYPDQAKLPMPERMNLALHPEDDRIWTKEEVDAILANDLQRFERGVTQYCGILAQGKFDAIVCFAFNLGLGTLQRSTLRQKILRRDYEAAAAEFLKFTKAGGKVLPGLVKRRGDERTMFLS
ncbi:COG3772 Phage-related lysozyme (muraminidase) [uncultured Caudovirales phage]|uniref:Endolysin n=1 Tax=uncultured Caudovirales phage TaxID=2100421 RepID=A0A6J5MTW0_9CAUD|nr:COG3772 Phage-related lysozyme (muraminidase) [uncultured Caudovirales phage]